MFIETALNKFLQEWRNVMKAPRIHFAVFVASLIIGYGLNAWHYGDRVDNLKSILSEETLLKEQWKKCRLDIPKRKNKKVSVYEETVRLKGCDNEFRQIIIKDHGRINPTYIITNNFDLKLIDVLKVYAKRWHIENKISEMVSFFNLNSLSSPLMIRIHFDILWTLIADTLYRRFAQDLRRFEKCIAPTIFKQFINMPGRIKYDGEIISICIRKRAHTPILKGIDKLNTTFNVPWLNNIPMKIEWTP